MEVSCQCKAIKFKTPTPAPLALYHCHCTQCRHQSSTAYGTSAIFPVFELPSHLTEKLGIWSRPTESGRIMDCYFCKTCGARIMHRSKDKSGKEGANLSIKGGCIEGMDWSGGIHIWTKEAVVPIPEGVESWEGEPPDD